MLHSGGYRRKQKRSQFLWMSKPRLIRQRRENQSNTPEQMYEKSRRKERKITENIFALLQWERRAEKHKINKQK